MNEVFKVSASLAGALLLELGPSIVGKNVEQGSYTLQREGTELV